MEAADGNHLVFGEETTIESLKDTFTNSPHYSGIKFHCCPILPQEQFHDLIVTLRQDLNSLSISQSPWVDDETLEIFTAYCHKIKNLELTGCLSKVTRAGIESIGRNLGELQSLAINYTNNVKNDAIASDHSWTLDNCIFPALINNSSSQVQHFSLSGFQSITYDALRKFLDNFKSSLTSLDFSDLMIVDDAALGDIGKMCVNLVQIKVNNCSNISDEGLTVFSNHCSNLTCFESAGCDLLTDEGTKVLAEACSKLEKIRLDFCSKITESSLEYLATYCSSLKCIHCEKTGIKYVPVSIFKLQHLDKLCIDNCDSLRFPRASIVAKGLPAIKEVVIHTDISRRVKVVAVGCAQSGKTSLLMSIQSLSPNVADGETFGVPTHLWMPFRDCNGEVMASLTEAVGAEIVAMNSDLTTELWDCSGRKALQGVHPLLFSGRAIYLLPFNVGLYNSKEKIPQWISAIQGTLDLCHGE